MFAQIAVTIAKGTISALQAYNRARQQQIQLEMQADSERYQAGVAWLNRTASANDIYRIAEASDIQRSQYGQQAAQLIASTRLSAASRGVVGTTGSAAAQTAGAEFAAQRDLYSMSQSTLQQLNNQKMQVTSYAAQANMHTMMAGAYESAADEVNPFAAMIAQTVVDGLNSLPSFMNGNVELQNYSPIGKQPTDPARKQGTPSNTGVQHGPSMLASLGNMFSSIGFS